MKRKTLRNSMYVVVQPSLDLDRFIVFTHWSGISGKTINNI